MTITRSANFFGPTPVPFVSRKPKSLGRFPPAAMIRAFLLAVLAVVACVWAVAAAMRKPEVRIVPDEGEDLIEVPIDTD